MTLLVHALAFLLGVALGAWAGGPRDGWLALAAALMGLRLLRSTWQGLRFWRAWRAHPLTAAMLVALGAARLTATAAPLTDPGHVAAYAWAHPSAAVRVVGTVVRPPQRLAPDAWALVLEVQRVRPLDTPAASAVPLRGRVWVRCTDPRTPAWRYGDLVVLRGRLLPLPAERPTYRAYLARQGAAARLYAYRGGRLQSAAGLSFWGLLYALRDRAHALVLRYWPAPEGPLFAGVLLGLEDDIPEAVYAAFRATGTAHIIVISGFNITVIAGLVTRLTARSLGRTWGAVLAALAVGAYTLLVGADPPVVRAALMGGLSLLARQVGRRQHGYTTLAFSAAVMVAAQPWALWDIGFQLSFAATLGLMLYTDPLSRGARRLLERWLPARWLDRLQPWLEEFVLLTLAAQTLTLPLSAYYFHRVSPVALLANPLILPAQAPLMVLGGLAVLVGLVVEPLGRALAVLAWPWAAFTIRVVLAFARLPRPTWHVGYGSAATVALVYGLLALATWALRRSRGRWRLHPGWVALGLAALDVWLWGLVRLAPDGRLHVWFLPTAQGQAVLVQFPAGARALINGGSDAAALDHALGALLGPGGRALDLWVVASNRDAEVAALAEVVDRYPPRRVWWLPGTGGEPGYRALRAALDAAAVPVVPAQAGARWRAGPAVLTARAVTPRGGQVLVEQGAFRALLTWDDDGRPWPEGLTVAWLAAPGVGVAEPWRTEPRLVLLGPAWPRDAPGPRGAACRRVAAAQGVHVWTDGRGWGVALGRNTPQAACDAARPERSPSPTP